MFSPLQSRGACLLLLLLLLMLQFTTGYKPEIPSDLANHLFSFSSLSYSLPFSHSLCDFTSRKK